MDASTQDLFPELTETEFIAMIKHFEFQASRHMVLALIYDMIFYSRN